MTSLLHRGQVTNPPHGLVIHGPLVDVRFKLSRQEETARTARGLPVPEPVQGKVLIDTGAQGTHVYKSIAEQLGLAPIRFQPVMGENLRAEQRPVYRMAIEIGMAGTRGTALVWFEADMTGAPGTYEATRGGEKVVGLLGRDFLSSFHFHYHGPSGTFELELDPAESVPLPPPGVPLPSEHPVPMLSPQRSDSATNRGSGKAARKAAKKSRRKNRRK